MTSVPQVSWGQQSNEKFAAMKHQDIMRGFKPDAGFCASNLYYQCAAVIKMTSGPLCSRQNREFDPKTTCYVGSISRRCGPVVALPRAFESYADPSAPKFIGFKWFYHCKMIENKFNKIYNKEFGCNRIYSPCHYKATTYKRAGIMHLFKTSLKHMFES